MSPMLASVAADITGEQRLIEAIAQHGIEHLGHDPEFARRAAEKHFEKVFSAQANKDAVAREALDLLADHPPPEPEAQAGPTALDEAFLGPFERYAEQASTEQLRLKWARVLTAEIRKPGSFSGKVLRLVDELDAGVAELFEKLCKSRLANTLPKALVGDLSFPEVALLTSAGLIHEPGLTGQVRTASKITDGRGQALDVFVFGNRAVSIPGNVDIAAQNPEPKVIQPGPHLPVYVLTSEGNAVATILPDNQDTAAAELARRIKSALRNAHIVEYRQDSAGNWPPVASY